MFWLIAEKVSRSTTSGWRLPNSWWFFMPSGVCGSICVVVVRVGVVGFWSCLGRFVDVDVVVEVDLYLYS